ncbi:MAG: carbon-nitrogen hydrolase family protein [Dermatophilus congolensis]|nr:carbon-nitrogen hydrolase family protein [Dermatophilus congolensis]
MRVALAQINSSADLAANLELMAAWSAKAVEAGADLVVFPEATMRAFGNRLTDIAEPLDGPWAQGVRAIAREHGIVIAVGMFTPGSDAGHVRNTLLVTGPGVEESYDKIHLFDAFGFAESDTVDPGDDVVTVEIGGVRFGLAICYDIRFPRLFTALARLGAEATLVVASWGAGEGKVTAWQTLAAARAMDATTYVLACGQADPEAVGRTVEGKAPLGVGHSIAVAPSGRVLASAGAGEELLLVDIDPTSVPKARKVLPVLANARDL